MIAVDYHTKKKTIWGRGNVENIRKMAVENRATAVMVNIDSLTPMQQQVEMHKLFTIMWGRHTECSFIILQFCRKTSSCISFSSVGYTWKCMFLPTFHLRIDMGICRWWSFPGLLWNNRISILTILVKFCTKIFRIWCWLWIWKSFSLCIESKRVVTKKAQP